MRFEQVKRGARIMSKITGKNYEVTSKSGEKIFADVVKDDGSVDSENGITITPEQSIGYRVIEWPKDTEIPEGYMVDDGKLKDRAGNDVTEQGEIFIGRIIANLPGQMLLAVRPKDGREGYIDLFIYEPGRDRFNKIIRDTIPDVKVEESITDGETGDVTGVILSYVEKHKEEETETDAAGQAVTVEKDVVTGSAVILVMNGRASSYRTENEYRKLISVAGDRNAFIVKETSEDGDLYRTVRISDGGLISGNYMTATGDVLKASTTAAYPTIVLIGSGFIQNDLITFKTPYVKDIAGDYLVDITECGKGETRITMANEKMETTTISRRNTPDRGYVYAIIA